MRYEHYDKIAEYVKKGWITERSHPTLPLRIYNYTPVVQYDRLWDEVTIQCRGLVLTEEGDIVARPFKKFFNYEEGGFKITPDFDVYEKMDGSLGILFMYGGEWIFASRGSFTSDQCIRGKALLSKYNLDLLSAGYTYLFEIIYDENRIVCKYDFEDIVLLGCIETTDGNEIDIHNEYYTSNFNVVKKYNGLTDLSSLKGTIDNNREGYVIVFTNGDRCKIKGEEYLRLHRLLTQVSNISIWEILKNSSNIDEILDRVPDEFYKWVRDTASDITRHFDAIVGLAVGFYQDVILRNFQTRKEVALYVQKNVPVTYRGLVFALYDNKQISEAVWKLVKPKYSKPFTEQKEND